MAPQVDTHAQAMTAQILLHLGEPKEAIAVCNKCPDASGQITRRAAMVTALAKFHTEDSSGPVQAPPPGNAGDPFLAALCGVHHWKEKQFALAIASFQRISRTDGFDVEASYNIAVCHYELKQYTACLQCIEQITTELLCRHPGLKDEAASHEHEMSIGTCRDFPLLPHPALVETLNLKRAIGIACENIDHTGAKAELRPLTCYDAVTVHNEALVNSEWDTGSALDKLRSLVEDPPFPPEAKHAFDFAADIMAEYRDLLHEYLLPDEIAFLEALVLSDRSPETAIKMLENLRERSCDQLRNSQHTVQIVIAQAKIYAERRHYGLAESALQSSAEFCELDSNWQLSMAHVLFLQGKYPEAISYYERILKSNESNLRGLKSLLLANLCAAYVRTHQYDRAKQILECV
ncbi:tetratricopeptide repeat-containing protein [Besnoitia besnoiti]|uniref:Tetratricopeptide repeat-containing protein n=1 Tax=Besnoitia besnoiti TaxID=94643 RepID=A0A2A9MAQ4_BESBE|nr:tetratricopeptide repeat-containing protein [Besnoitia besnoiti]PFH33381.1 tetratricopeptide repeat-containing protein [Besnoitia besnoiti]